MEVLAFLIGFTIFVGIAILFPLWAASEAENKGLSKFSKIAKISIFFLMGHVGGLIALIASSKLPYTAEGLAKKQKNPKHTKLMEGGLMITAGVIISILGFVMNKAFMDGVHGVVIIDFIPIPSSVFPILTMTLGVGLIFFGSKQVATTLFNKSPKKE